MSVNSSLHESSYLASGVEKNVLETSAKMVDFQMQFDSSYPEMLDCFKRAGGSLPSVSGLSDYDYHGISELSTSLHSLSQLNVIERFPLHTKIVEQFNFMQSNCGMGFFPEINRAWLAIDSNLYVWSIQDSTDLLIYSDLTQTILSVGLVKPKPEVFQDRIHYLICLTTPVEISVLGCTFNESFGDMKILEEPVFVYPTDNVDMCCFGGTAEGRIFFGARDGCVYEFAYQAQDTWFRQKCKKINHSNSSLSFLVPSFLSLAFSENDAVLQIAIDNSRHILYTRMEKGAIQVFDLGVKGDEMSKVAVMHHHTMVQQASDTARTIDKTNFYPIVHIEVIEATEAKNVHLVAVSQTGVRLYFSVNNNYSDSRPYTLTLLHVRLPPGFTANASICRPSCVKLACYKKGFFILVSAQSDEGDLLLATCNDSFAFYHQLIETHSATFVDNFPWALAEFPTSFPLKVQQIQDGITSDPPTLVTQHKNPPRKFVLLSGQGIVVFTKLRPVDQLYKLLKDNQGPDCESVKAFFMIHKESQACAMCLILACSQTRQDKQVAEWANRAFFIWWTASF